MKKYTEKQMEQIRTLAFIQMKEGIYLINVPMSKDSDQDLLTPWMDSTGRFDLTDYGAVKYWGEETFSEFCEKALAYLADDTVSDRFQH